MVKISVVVAVFMLLSGCAEYRARMAAQQAAAQAQIDAQDDATCRSYGAQPGSDTYVACRMNMANNRHADAVLENIQQQQRSEALMATGAAMMANGR
jgi:hypothetical protein